MKSRILPAAGWMATAMAGGACADVAVDERDAGPDAPADTFEVVVGVPDETFRFAPIRVDDTVEIVVGFQGLIFIDLLLDVPADVPWRLGADCDVSFDDRPDFDFAFRVNLIEFDSVAERRRGELRVHFGQDVALIDGRDISIAVRLFASGWEGRARASFRIADDERCIENPAGELECE